MRPRVLYVLAIALVTGITPAHSQGRSETMQDRAQTLLEQYAPSAVANASSVPDSTHPRLIDSLGAESTGGLQVCTMPGTRVDQSGNRRPFVWRDRTFTVWGRAEGGVLPYSWTWDFGDGAPFATGTASNTTQANDIATTHRYATQGAFTARLTIRDAAGTVAAAEIAIEVVADDRQVRIDAAIEDGLRALYLGQYADGSWSLEEGLTAAALVAFQLRGHLLTNEPCSDIYAASVKRGINYILSRGSLSSLVGPYPDVNGNGQGVLLTSNGYRHGLSMMALGTSRALSYVAPSGALAGRPVRDILADAVEQCYASQARSGVARGGWRYSVLSGANDADNSAVQWIVLGLEAAREAGIPIADQVRSELAIWTQTSQHSNGGFGYTTAAEWTNIAKTAAGLIELAFLGAPAADARVVQAIGFIDQTWSNANDGLGAREHLNGNLYAMYSLAKSLRSLRYIGTGLPITHVGPRDWYEVYVDHLLYHPTWRQQGSGNWPDSYWLGNGAGATAFAILTLNPEAVVDPKPVARASASPGSSSCPNIPVRFDGSLSTHQDGERSIVQWLWDFDESNGVDFDNPDALGPVVLNAAGYALPPGITSYVYYAVLRVADDSAPPKFSTVRVPIIVNNANNPPVACLRPNCDTTPYSGVVGQAITFDGSPSHDPDACNGDFVASYSWDLDGDGVFGDATGAIVSHTWTQPHYGQVGLRVFDSHGLQSPGHIYVDVYASDRNLKLADADVLLDPPCATCPANQRTIRARVHWQTRDNASLELKATAIAFFEGTPATPGRLIGRIAFGGLVASPTTLAFGQVWEVANNQHAATPFFVSVDPQNLVFEWDEQDNTVGRLPLGMQLAWDADPVQDCAGQRSGVFVMGSVRRLKWRLDGPPGTTIKREDLRLMVANNDTEVEVAAEFQHDAEATGHYSSHWVVPYLPPELQSDVWIQITTRPGSAMAGLSTSPSSPFALKALWQLRGYDVSDIGHVAGTVALTSDGRLSGPGVEGDEVHLFKWRTAGSDVTNKGLQETVKVATLRCDGTFAYRLPTGALFPATLETYRTKECLITDATLRHVLLRNGVLQTAWTLDARGCQACAHDHHVLVATDHEIDANQWGFEEFDRKRYAPSLTLEPPMALEGQPEVSATPPLVLLNGWTEASGAWKDLGVSLRRDHRNTWEFYYPSFETGVSLGAALLGRGLDYLGRLLPDSDDALRGLFGTRAARILNHSYGGLVTRAYLQDEHSDTYTYQGRRDVQKVLFLTSPLNGSTVANAVINDKNLLGPMAELLKCSSRSSALYRDLAFNSEIIQRLNGKALPDLNTGFLVTRPPLGQYLSLASTRQTCNLLWIGQSEAQQADGPVSVASASLIGKGVPLLTDGSFDHSEMQKTDDIAPAIQNFFAEPVPWSSEREQVIAGELTSSLDENAVGQRSVYWKRDGAALTSVPELPEVFRDFDTRTLPLRYWGGAVSFIAGSGSGRVSLKSTSKREVIKLGMASEGRAADGVIAGEVGFYRRFDGATPGRRFHASGFGFGNVRNEVPLALLGNQCLGVLRVASDEVIALPAGAYSIEKNGSGLSHTNIKNAQVTWETASLTIATVALSANGPVELQVIAPDGSTCDPASVASDECLYDHYLDPYGGDRTFVRMPSMDGRYVVSVRLLSAPSGESSSQVGAAEDAVFSVSLMEGGVTHQLAENVPIAMLPREFSVTVASPPGSPQSLVAVAGSGVIALSWQPPLLGAASGYRVFYNLVESESSAFVVADDAMALRPEAAVAMVGGYDGTEAAEGVSGIDVPGDQTTFLLTCLTSRPFRVVVSAVDSVGRQSEWSNEVVATPLAVGGTLFVTPRTLNLTSAGQTVKALIELDAGYSPGNFVAGSLRLNDVLPAEQVSVGDANGNGTPDITVRFSRTAVAFLLEPGEQVPVWVTGQVTGCSEAVAFLVRDSIRVILPKVKSPESGSTLVSGSVHEIVWTTPAGMVVDSVSIRFSADNMRTWQSVARRLQNQGRYSWIVPGSASDSCYVAVVLYEKNKEAGIGYGGPFRVTGTVEVEPQGGIPRRFALHAVRPNPMTFESEVSFDLPIASSVRLRVFDVGGRSVETLIDGPVSAGRHVARWAARTVSTGIYFVRLETASFRASQQVVVVR